MKWIDRLEFAKRLARRAGARATAFYMRANEQRSKAGGEPVTDADVAINDLIVEAVASEFPDDDILAEESEQDSRSGDKPVWIIDPIDGTREFITGSGQFAVHIGYVVDERPVLGVVYHAACHRMFFGGPEMGAFMEEHGVTTAIHVSSNGDIPKMRMAVSRAHRSKHMRKILDALMLGDTVLAGGVGIKSCLVASGQADVYLHPSAATSQWDTAAPEAIVLGAGGAVSDLLGHPLCYRPAQAKMRRGLAFSNNQAHEAILSQVRPVVDAWQAKVLKNKG